MSKLNTYSLFGNVDKSIYKIQNFTCILADEGSVKKRVWKISCDPITESTVEKVKSFLCFLLQTAGRNHFNISLFVKRR